MALPLFSSEERSLLESLVAHKVRFMIVGMTGAVLQGAQLITQYVDLWVENLGNEPFMKALESVGAFYIPPGIAGMNPPMLGPSEYRIFDLVTHMDGIKSFSEEYANAQTVEFDGLSFRVLPLERIIVSKESADREKDRKALPALKAALAVHRKSSKKL